MSDQGEEAAGRTVLRISGADREDFLQGLVTNDLRRLRSGATYAALLSPQGKYLADFFLIADGDSILLDVAAPLADGLLRRLSLYRLRADVQIAPTAHHVHRGLGHTPADGFADPRHPALGWRAYRDHPGGNPVIGWDAIRVAHLIPESGVELIPDESYILECGFERLNGVDFRKGCYVGQEVTARMKHKTELRKGLALVDVSGPAAPGTPILTVEKKEAGTLLSRSGNQAIAYLRLDRTGVTLMAGTALVTIAEALPADEGQDT